MTELPDRDEILFNLDQIRKQASNQLTEYTAEANDHAALRLVADLAVQMMDFIQTSADST